MRINATTPNKPSHFDLSLSPKIQYNEEMETIGFVGLGKLGLPCAAAISYSLKRKVVGTDIDKKVKGFIEDSKIPYLEEFAEEYLTASEVTFVDDIKEVVQYSSIIFFAVQTPHDSQFEGNTPVPEETQDFSYEYLKASVKSVCDEIDRQGKSDVLLVVISTVLPGTMRREIIPILKSYKTPIEFCYNPFFIAMGTTIRDFLGPEFILIGSDEMESRERLARFYKAFINSPVKLMRIESAELTKVSYNTFIGFKIVFANNLAEICASTGGDVDEITSALAEATNRIVSGRYLSAGMADGGGCHPRDQIAMSHLAKSINTSVNLFDWLARSRDSQTKRQAEFIRDKHLESGLPVVLMGQAYKKNVNLTVGSPALLLSFFLDSFGIFHTFYDPHVKPEILLPSKPGLFFISCNHDVFRDVILPQGSICIDPWGAAVKEVEGVRIIRPGRQSFV